MTTPSGVAERSIYLVRHGETTGESSIRYHGRNDVPLSDLGRRQVQGLVPFLRHVHFAAVVHSPLSRAGESAEILVDGMVRPPALVEQAPDLVEIDFGAMEGLTEAEIAADLPEFYAEWKGGRATGFPGGESFAGFATRVGVAIDGLIARHPVGDLLVVAHKGIVKRAVGRLLQLPGDGPDRLNPELGSLTVVSCGAKVELKHFGLTAALD